MRSWLPPVLVALALPLAGFTRPADPWPTFRGGPGNAGLAATRVRPLADRPSQRPVATFATRGLIWGTPVIGADGTVYVGSADKSCYALAPDGRGGYTQRWSYPIFDRPDAVIDSACALTPDGLVVIPGGDGYLHALTQGSGFPRWTFRAAAPEAVHQKGQVVGSFEGNVQVGPDGTLYAGCDDGAMYALAPDGRVRWRRPTGMMVWSTPAIDPAGRWLAFGSLDGHVYLLDPVDGRVLDRFAAGGEVTSSPAADPDGRLYVGTSGGRVLALDVVAGRRLREAWAFDAGAEVYASPARWGDVVIAGAMDGRVHGLGRDGTPRWTYRARGRVAASAVVSQDGVAFLGSSDGTLYALDAARGSRIWSFRATPSRLRANLDASPALAPDGVVHVGSYDGRVYGVPYEWPLAHRDDPRVAVGGHEDLPDWGPPAQAATLRVQDANGAYHAAPPAPLGLGETLRLRLVAPGDDAARTRFALNPGGLTVSLEPGGEVVATPSSDGRFLDVAPRGLFTPETAYRLRVRGSYRTKQAAWPLDRLNPFAEARPFQAELAFTTAPAGPSAPPGPLAWAASRLYLHQPAALDTYTPAALDGQAAILVAPAGVRPDGTVALLGLSALPGPRGPRPLAEPSKVFTLEGRVAHGWLKARGRFRLAAMGGDVPFESFVAAAPLRPDGTLGDGEFTARAPLWGIRGSGATYSFPLALLNEVADHGLRLIALGAFTGGAPAPVEPPLAVSGARRTATGVALTLSAPPAGEHLLAALAIDAAGRPAGHAATRVAAGHRGEVALSWATGLPGADAEVYLVWDGLPLGRVP